MAQRCARLHGDGDEPLVDEPLPNDFRGGRERGVRRGRVADLPAEAHVVRALGPHDGRTRRQRLLDVRHRGEWIVIHDHQLGRIAGGVRGVGDDHRDGFADVVHFIHGDRVVVARLELREQPADGDAVDASFDEVGPRVHANDAGMGTSGVEIDGADARVCVRASNERGVHRPDAGERRRCRARVP